MVCPCDTRARPRNAFPFVPSCPLVHFVDNCACCLFCDHPTHPLLPRARRVPLRIKLGMYSSLATVMGVFVGLVTTVTLTMVAARSGGGFAWPWQLFWAQTVPWEVLNLAVMVAVSVIWRPSVRAKLLVSSVQLSMVRRGSYWRGRCARVCVCVCMCNSVDQCDRDDNSPLLCPLSAAARSLYTGGGG